MKTNPLQKHCLNKAPKNYLTNSKITTIKV